MGGQSEKVMLGRLYALPSAFQGLSQKILLKSFEYRR